MSDSSTSPPGGGRDREEHPTGARPKERPNVQQLRPSDIPAFAGQVGYPRTEEQTITQSFSGPIDTRAFAGYVNNLYLPPQTAASSSQPVIDENFGSRVKEILNKRTKKYAVPRTVGKLKTPKTWINPETYEIDFFTSAVPEQEYKPELEFTQQKQKQEGKLILPKDFFQNNEDGSPVRTVAVVGGAGYGKTEMLNRFALDVLDEKIPLLDEVEMVHLLRFRDFTEKGKLKPGKLFFGNTDLNDKGIIDPSVDYIRENPNKFLLVIDGADQYEDKQDKLGTESPAAQYKEEYFTTDILNSLLSGKLFPNIRVLYSSREHTMRHFENGVRPQRVIALAGFLEDDVETLVHELAGHQGEEIWEVLSTKSPGLLSACSIPIYLNFTVSVLLTHINNPPETLTGVMMHVLNDIVKSNHIRIKQKIFKVIHALKTMSYFGTKAGKVTFTSSDLPLGITESDYRDLIIPLVGATGTNQRLFDGNIKFVFIHQSLQEAISALYIADMKFGKFKKFVSKQLHTPHWVVVRRILCGILLHDSTFQVMREIDPFTSLLESGQREKKMKYLRQNLVSQLKKPAWWRLRYREREGPEFVELLHAIHESGDDDVISSIWKIDVQDLILTLTPSDWHVITSTMSRAKNLEKVLLPKIHERNLATIAQSLSSSNNKIPRIQEIYLESDLNERDVSNLATILEFCSNIDDLRLGKVGPEAVATLAAALGNSTVEIGRLSIGVIRYEWQSMNEHAFNNLATVLKRCPHIHSLSLPELGLKYVTTLASILKDSRLTIRRLGIQVVNVKESNLTNDDVNNLTTVLNRCSYVSGLCLLDANHLRTLASARKDSKLRIDLLDIGDRNNKVPLQRETSLAICEFLSSVKFRDLPGFVHLYYTASDEEINLIQWKTRELRRQRYDITMFNEYGRQVVLSKGRVLLEDCLLD